MPLTNEKKYNANNINEEFEKILGNNCREAQLKKIKEGDKAIATYWRSFNSDNSKMGIIAYAYFERTKSRGRKILYFMIECESDFEQAEALIKPIAETIDLVPLVNSTK